MKFKTLLAVGLAALVAISCTKKKKSGDNLNINETLRINVSTEPPSLDWTKSTDTTSGLIQENIMEGLTHYDLNDPELKLLPGLATEWTPENNAQKWTFYLRKEVKWNDGIEFEAQHLVDSWERLLNPATASEYAYFLYGIKNGKEYNEGKVTDFSQVGVKAVDKYTVKVELVGPQSYFPQLLTHHVTYPIRKDVIEKHGDRWTEPENIVTLGAYNLKKWEHDKSILLERNEIYYGKKANIKYVLAYMISEMQTAINLVDKGKLDVQLTLPSTDLPKLKQRKDYKENSILSIYYYGFNVKKAPTDNALVRRAISKAIDRKQVTEMLAGGQVPLTSWVPPGMFGYLPNVGVEYNPKKAAELLDKAGFKDRTKFPKITLSYNTNENHKRIAESIQAQLKKNLGIQVEIKNEEWKVYLSSLKVDPPNIYRMGWLADFPDPDNFLNLMTSYSDNNHTNWGNAEFDKLIESAASELDKGKRKEYYSKAQKILTEMDVPVAPMFSSVVQKLVAPRVKNFPASSMSRYPFKDVSLQ